MRAESTNGAGSGGMMQRAAYAAMGVALGLSAIGAALPAVLFSYLGWNATVYVASELRRPARDLPRSLFLGLGVSALVYLVITSSYVVVLGTDGVIAAPRVAEATAAAAFGAKAGKVVGALVLLSVFGTLNASVLVGPRIAFAMARDGLAPRALATPSPRTQAPVSAIAVQAAVACALVLVLGRFPSVLDYTTFAIVLATIADVVALYVLRARRPDAARPYRAWGYPWVPALYVAANVVIAVAMVRASPKECAVSVAIVAISLIFYAIATRLRSDARG